MNIRPIRNDDDLARALARMEKLWGAPAHTPEGDELDILGVLVEAYESAHHPVPVGDPAEVIRYKMNELGLTQRALTQKMGWTSSGRLSEVLSGKRDLTVRMVHDLSKALGVPSGLLLGDQVPGPARPSAGLELPPGLAADIQVLAARGGVTPTAWLRRVVAEASREPAQVVRTRATVRGCAGTRSLGSRAVDVSRVLKRAA